MTKEQTLAILTGRLPGPEDRAGNSLSRHSYIQDQGVSEWVLAEYVASKSYPYLDPCTKEIVKKHGLKLTENQMRALKTMVYFASVEDGRRRDEADGWLQPSDEWLAQRVGKMIEVRTEGLFGYGLKRCRVIRNAEGKLYIMKPRARRYAFSPSAQIKVRDPRGTPPTPMPGAMTIVVNGKEAA